MMNDKNILNLIESMMDNICIGIKFCTCESDFIFRFVNEAFACMLGYTKEDIGDSYLALVYPEDRDYFANSLKSQLSDGSGFCAEYRMVKKDGSVIWVLDRGKVIDEKGERILQCVLIDITDKKLLEEELRISKKRHEIVLETSDINMFEYDFATKELTLFENINQMYDIPNVVENGVETFVKDGIIEPESAKDYVQMYKEIWQGKDKASCYVKTRDKEGDIHDYELSLTAVFDEFGNTKRAIGVRRNVTDIMSLKREREFSRRLTEHKEFMVELNVTKNRIDYVDSKWLEAISIDPKTCYNDYISEAINYYVAPEHRNYVGKSLSREHIRHQASLGKFAYSFAYKRRDEKDLRYRWYESTVSIVKDKSTGDTVARIHREDVNERKEREIKTLEEQRRYRRMVDKSLFVFEINFTKDIIYKGHEHWYRRNNKKISYCYSQVIADFASINLSKGDGARFLSDVSSYKMIELFKSGKSNFNYEFNEILGDGSSRWLECELYFYEDADNGDVRCFAYMNDIEQRKARELKLEFDAQHDAMTRMYNKIKSQEKIDAALRKKSDKLSALFVVDIDGFKSINDNFGHVFGDEVIKDVAKNIFNVFRHSDIIGRIGGDEFCIFMEGINTLDDVKKKAEELRLRVAKSYWKDEKEGKVSISIGIAVAGPDKATYHELYINADSALYLAKNSGKNNYKIAK